MSLEPRVLLEDTHLIVLSKPAGLLSQGEHTGDLNLVDWLRERWGRPYVGLVHRLDRNTSGLMVVAKRTKAANRLTQALQEGSLVRVYRAILRGQLQEPQDWRHFLEKDERTNTVRVVPQSHSRSHSNSRAKEARLRVLPIQAGGSPSAPLTLVEFTLDTGRSHQIRVQAQAQGMPLLGDQKYSRASTGLGPAPGMHRPALHSFRLSFPHPMGGAPMSFEDPVPAEWDQILRSANPLR
jgi:23S rRNA pseudouridine1911/1915/1917 synthase